MSVVSTKPGKPVYLDMRKLRNFLYRYKPLLVIIREGGNIGVLITLVL